MFIKQLLITWQRLLSAGLSPSHMCGRVEEARGTHGGERSPGDGRLAESDISWSQISKKR